MGDTYQAVYDAVRSRISTCDIGSVVERAMLDANLSHYAQMASASAQEAASEAMRPSVLYRPSMGLDGTLWCALYGDDLMNGVAGFGDTPAKAMSDFDAAWWKAQTPAAVRKVDAQ